MSQSKWDIVERQEGSGKDARVSHDVTKDRRTISTGLNRDSAERLVRSTRNTDDPVALVEVDGYRTDITRKFEPRGWRKPVRRR